MIKRFSQILPEYIANKNKWQCNKCDLDDDIRLNKPGFIATFLRQSNSSSAGSDSRPKLDNFALSLCPH